MCIYTNEPIHRWVSTQMNPFIDVGKLNIEYMISDTLYIILDIWYMIKQVFHSLVQIYLKNVESIISRRCSSSLRIKRFLKIQNPIWFKDFMAEKRLEYRFTEKLNFSVFFVRRFIFAKLSPSSSPCLAELP